MEPPSSHSDMWYTHPLLPFTYHWYQVYSLWTQFSVQLYYYFYTLMHQKMMKRDGGGGCCCGLITQYPVEPRTRSRCGLKNQGDMDLRRIWCLFIAKVPKNSGKVIQKNKIGDRERVLVGRRCFGSNFNLIIPVGESSPYDQLTRTNQIHQPTLNIRGRHSLPHPSSHPLYGEGGAIISLCAR